MDRNECLRWTNPKTKRKLSWRETLESMCNTYGTFCGRWHSNEFWKRTKETIPNITEEQAKDKVIQIEQEADSSLAYWKRYQ